MITIRTALLAALMMGATASIASAAGMTLTSSTIAGDGEGFPPDSAASGDCGGKNISPGLAWSGAPKTTASYALTIWDQDGQKGQGVSHWVAYGIAPTMTSIPAGFGSAPSPAYVGGTNTRKTTLYFGPCPPIDDTPHHYVITVYALDLPPTALPAGLTREAFYPAILNHTVGVTSFVGIYGR
jgi:Raf kinase inhibitor-like YbhB/YbcL family protein